VLSCLEKYTFTRKINSQEQACNNIILILADLGAVPLLYTTVHGKAHQEQRGVEPISSCVTLIFSSHQNILSPANHNDNITTQHDVVKMKP
jgi:hypothetical protein